MKTRMMIYFLALFNLFVISSCSTSKYIAKDEPYTNYSEKLGVKLQGDEDLALLKSFTEWKGVPYKYGGNTKKGTDCSGFVTSVYMEVYGKQLQRSSKDMVNDVRFVSKNDLKSGDLLFFKINGKNISHVGIYIAENKFIHASTKKGVVVNDLSQEYYSKSFYKGGRVRR